MNAYNLVSKKTLYPSQIDPLSLIEYMIINDRDLDEHLMILKLKNQSSYKIDDIEIMITEKNKAQEPIKTTHYKFSDLNLEANQEMVPLKKIKVDQTCVQIKYQLITVSADGHVWEHGKWDHEIEEEPIEAVNLVETIEEEIEEDLTYQLTVVTHQKLSVPYFIMALVVVVFVLVVVSVFNALN